MGTSADGQRWASWLGERVATRGAGGRMSHAELRERLEAAGHGVTGSTISRWMAGVRVGSPELAEAVGVALGDRTGALLAAGYVDRSLGHFRREGDPATVETIVIGANPEQWERIRHMTLEEIAALGEGPIILIERSAPNGG